MLAKKAPQVTNPSVMFCPPTLNMYKDVWALHLRNEMLIDRIRHDYLLNADLS
jgi:hypothetical protein